MIFVTGGTGLTGARLLYDLASQDVSVTALKRTTSSMKILDYYFKSRPDLYSKIKWVTGDITDPGSFTLEAGAEVYHCAGMVSFDPADRNELYAVNIRGTENLVNACIEAGIKKLVYVSSVASLGRSNDIYIDEESHWENDSNNSDYSISKFGGEREVWRGIAEGLNAVIINPSVIIGAGDWSAGSMKLISRMDEGLKFYTEGISGFVDVKDISKIMIALMKSDIHSQRFIINSENVPYRHLFETIASVLSKKAPSIKARKWMGELMWRWEWLVKQLTGKKPLITKYSAATAYKHYHYRNDKIKELLHYDFIPVKESLENSAREYLKYKLGH